MGIMLSEVTERQIHMISLYVEFKNKNNSNKNELIDGEKQIGGCQKLGLGRSG